MNGDPPIRSCLLKTKSDKIIFQQETTEILFKDTVSPELNTPNFAIFFSDWLMCFPCSFWEARTTQRRSLLGFECFCSMSWWAVQRKKWNSTVVVAVCCTHFRAFFDLKSLLTWPCLQGNPIEVILTSRPLSLLKTFTIPIPKEVKMSTLHGYDMSTCWSLKAFWKYMRVCMCFCKYVCVYVCIYEYTYV